MTRMRGLLSLAVFDINAIDAGVVPLSVMLNAAASSPSTELPALSSTATSSSTSGNVVARAVACIGVADAIALFSWLADRAVIGPYAPTGAVASSLLPLGCDKTSPCSVMSGPLNTCGVSIGESVAVDANDVVDAGGLDAAIGGAA